MNVYTFVLIIIVLSFAYSLIDKALKNSKSTAGKKDLQEMKQKLESHEKRIQNLEAIAASDEEESDQTSYKSETASQTGVKKVTTQKSKG